MAKLKIMSLSTHWHPTGLSALLKSLQILSEKLFHYHPGFRELMGVSIVWSLITPYVCCLGGGEKRRRYMPSLSPCDGKCGMDHAYIDFFMIRKAVCPEKPQMIIIQFILLLWFFIELTQ